MAADKTLAHAVEDPGPSLKAMHVTFMVWPTYSHFTSLVGSDQSRARLSDDAVIKY